MIIIIIISLPPQEKISNRPRCENSCGGKKIFARKSYRRNFFFTYLWKSLLFLFISSISPCMAKEA